MRRNACRAGDGIFRTVCRTMGIQSYRVQVSSVQRLRRIRRCRSVQRVFPCPRCRNARCRNSRCQPGTAEGVRNRHLLGRGSRLFLGRVHILQQSRKLPPKATNGNYGGRTVRDHLCQIIRQHQLDAALVKSYATDFCGVKTLREATREQVENFVAHLGDWAERDRDALLCQLNSYLGAKEGAA